MSKTTWIVIGVLGGGAVLCCLGSLMAVLLFGQAEPSEPGAVAASGDDTAVAAPAGGGGGLEGTWMNGSVSTTEYRSIATGEFAPPSGTGVLLELKEGGGCTQSAIIQSTTYSCTSYIFTWYEDCAWSADGDTLTLELKGGTLKSRMCGGEVKEGDAKEQTRRHRYSIVTDSGWTWLTLTDDDGSELRYRRQ